MLHTLLYFLALFSLSTSPNWAKLNQMPVEVLGFYRLGIAAILIGLWILLTKPLSKPKINKTLWWAIASGFFFFLHLWTYKYAAKNTSVSNTMIIFSSNPIWTSIGAIAFFGEKLSKRLIVAYLLALIGVYLLVAHDFKIGLATSSGDWSAVISAFFYAAYMLTGKKSRHYYDNTYYALIQYSICALLFGLCILGTGASINDYTYISWISVLGLVFLATFLGHFSFTYLVKYMNISVMTCGKLIEPIMASIIAYFIFKEQISQYAWLSFMLTTTSVLVLFGPNLFNNVKQLIMGRNFKP